MLKPNIGLVNAMIRISCGLTILTMCSGKSRSNQNLILVVMASMKVAEGILRFCPIVSLINAYKAEKRNHETVHNE